MTRSRGPGTPEVIRPGLDRILAALDSVAYRAPGCSESQAAR